MRTGRPSASIPRSTFRAPALGMRISVRGQKRATTETTYCCETADADGSRPSAAASATHPAMGPWCLLTSLARLAAGVVRAACSVCGGGGGAGGAMGRPPHAHRTRLNSLVVRAAQRSAHPPPPCRGERQPWWPLPPLSHSPLESTRGGPAGGPLSPPPACSSSSSAEAAGLRHPARGVFSS